MRFQNVKAEELDGPIKVPGFTDWAKGLQGKPGCHSLILVSPSGTGKGSAVGLLANTLNYDITRCRLSQLLEYPDPVKEFHALLEGTEHLHHSIIWLDGLNGFFGKLTAQSGAVQEDLMKWLQSEAEVFGRNELVVVGTASEMSGPIDSVTNAFDRSFTA